MSEIKDLRRDVIELRDWKIAILDKCKASDGWDSLQWAGDKEGWGFVHFFIGHLETRALQAEKALAAAYRELKAHDADFHRRTSVDVNNMIVDAIGG